MVELDSILTIMNGDSAVLHGVDQVWQNTGYDGAGSTVAIIDTGIDGAHASIDDLDDDNSTYDPKVIGFYDAVKKLHKGGINGVAMRGHPNEASWHQTVFLKGLGGKYFEDIKAENYNPTINSPEAIKAAEMYADIFINYSPEGAVNFKYTDVVIAMQQGNTAIIMEGAPLGGKINDPEKSVSSN